MENNDTNNEKNVKKNSGFLYIIIILLVIVIVAIGVIFIYKKQNSNNEVNPPINNSSNENNSNENNNENDNENDNTNNSNIPYDTSTDDIFTYNVPDNFKLREAFDGVLDYYDSNLKCEFQLFSIATDKTIEEFVTSNDNYKFIKDISLNDATWKTYLNQSKESKENIYISEKNGHLIFYVFLDENECKTYENQILNTIKIK